MGKNQSREYQKRINEDDVINRIAYEVSVNKMEYCDDGMNLERKVAEFGEYRLKDVMDCSYGVHFYIQGK